MHTFPILMVWLRVQKDCCLPKNHYLDYTLFFISLKNCITGAFLLRKTGENITQENIANAAGVTRLILRNSFRTLKSKSTSFKLESNNINIQLDLEQTIEKSKLCY